MFIVGIYFLYAVILAVVVWIFARHEAEFSWWRLVFVALGFDVLHAILHAAALFYLPVPPLVSLLLAFVISCTFLTVAIYRVLYVPLSSSIYSALLTGVLWMAAVMALNAKERDYLTRGSLNADDYCRLISTPWLRKPLALNPAAKFYCSAMKARLPMQLMRIAGSNPKNPQPAAQAFMDKLGTNVRELLSPGQRLKFERLYLAFYLPDYNLYLPSSTQSESLRDIAASEFGTRDALKPGPIFAEIPNREAALELLGGANIENAYWAARWMLETEATAQPVPMAVANSLSTLTVNSLKDSAFLVEDGGAEVAQQVTFFLERYHPSKAQDVKVALSEAISRIPAPVKEPAVAKKPRVLTKEEVLQHLADRLEELSSPERDNNMAVKSMGGVKNIYAGHPDIVPDKLKTLTPILLGSPHPSVRLEVLKYIQPLLQPSDVDLLVQVANFEPKFEDCWDIALPLLLQYFPERARSQVIGKASDQVFRIEVRKVWVKADTVTGEFLAPLFESERPEVFDLAAAVLEQKGGVIKEEHLLLALKHSTDQERTEKYQDLLNEHREAYYADLSKKSPADSPNAITANALSRLYANSSSSSLLEDIVKEGGKVDFEYEVIPFAMRWLEDSGSQQAAAYLVLANLGTPEHLPLLKTFIETRAQDNQAAAAVCIFGLLRLDPPAGREAFSKFAVDSYARRHLVDAFRNSRPVVSEKEIIPLLQQSNALTLSSALQVLGIIGGAESLAILPKISAYHNGKLSPDELSSLNYEVEKALEEIRGRSQP